MARQIVKRITSTPIGSITTLAKGTVPTGYLACDGSVVSRMTYADLFAEIGITHGEGDGSTTFHLPDLRGRFLRGTDEATGRDPDAGGRIAPNAGGSTGDAVGSVQGEGTASNGLNANSSSEGNHMHGLWGSSTDHTDGSVATLGRGQAVGGTRQTPGDGYYNNWGGAGSDLVMNYQGSHSHSVIFATGDNETRSLNANVKYAIKY